MARKVWIAATRIAELGSRALAEARRRLGPRDRRRYAALGSDKRRREFLAGRWLLERSARAWRPDARLRFDSTAAGGISVNRHIGASVSHARGWVACALVEGGNPGIDIEPMIERDFKKLGEWMFGLDTPRLDFYGRWTRHEARLKAFGDGKARASHVEITYHFDGRVALSVCLPAGAAAHAPPAPRPWRRRSGFSPRGNLW